MEEEEVPAVPVRINITVDNFEDKLRELRVISESADEQSAALKVTKAMQENLSYHLAQYMLTSSIKSIVLDGTAYTQKQRVFSKVEDKDALREWIITNDAVDLLMAVHPSKLTAYCNEMLDAGGETPSGVNPNFIKYYVHTK